MNYLIIIHTDLLNNTDLLIKYSFRWNYVRLYIVHYLNRPLKDTLICTWFSCGDNCYLRYPFQLFYSENSTSTKVRKPFYHQ